MTLLFRDLGPVFLVATFVACVSCKSDSKENKAEETVADTKPDDSKVPDSKVPDTKPVDGQQAGTEDEEEEIAPEHMEQAVNASDTVKVVDFKGKLPDDGLLTKDLIKGKFHSILGWTDKDGMQALVFTTSVSEKEDATSSMIIADLFLREGDAWTSQRQFKASVDKCQFDTELKIHTGDWSIADLDKDDLGEVTFAWSVGCRSDVSPVAHKVFVISYKDAEFKKYVLRGETGIEMGGAVEGGAFKADKAFDTAPKAFLSHAEMVWKKTSTESFK